MPRLPPNRRATRAKPLRPKPAHSAIQSSTLARIVADHDREIKDHRGRIARIERDEKERQERLDGMGRSLDSERLERIEQGRQIALLRQGVEALDAKIGELGARMSGLVDRVSVIVGESEVRLGKALKETREGVARLEASIDGMAKVVGASASAASVEAIGHKVTELIETLQGCTLLRPKGDGAP